MASVYPPLARKPPNLADDLPIAQVALLSGVLYRATDAAWSDYEIPTCRILMPKASSPQSSGLAYF
jgi:hypothetical protein